MLMTPREARELARATVAMTAADQAEVLVGADSSALTRFANNRINQNVAEENVIVSVRAVLGKRVGVASTNRLDAASLQATCDAAVRAAGVAPEDPSFPGLPGPAPVADAERALQATREFDAEARAAAVGAIVAESAGRGLTAAGKVRSAEHTVAVANSLGVDVGSLDHRRAGHGAVDGRGRRAAAGRRSSTPTRASSIRRRSAPRRPNSRFARRTRRRSTPATTRWCSHPRRSPTSWTSWPTWASRPRPSPRAARS